MHALGLDRPQHKNLAVLAALLQEEGIGVGGYEPGDHVDKPVKGGLALPGSAHGGRPPVHERFQGVRLCKGVECVRMGDQPFMGVLDLCSLFAGAVQDVRNGNGQTGKGHAESRIHGPSLRLPLA